MAVGDTFWACACRLQYCGTMFWAGVNLSIIEEKISDAYYLMKQHANSNSLTVVLIIQRSVYILLGKETRRLTMSELETVCGPLSPFHKMANATYQLYLSLILNDGTLRESCEAYFRSEVKSSCTLMIFDSIQVYIAGLACYQVG